MKKFLLGIAVFITTAILCVVGAGAETYGDYTYTVLDDGTVEITNAGNGIYTLRVEAWDDATTPHKITVNWSGEPYFR